MHGGSTPVGLASPNITRGGRYSKFIPLRLSATYMEARGDPELLNLREEIALLDSRISDVLESVGNSEAGELWRRLKEALREYDHARGKDAEEKRAEAFGNIRWLINEGYQEWMSWRDVRNLVQERKSLVDSERARLKDMQQMISAESAMTLVAALTAAIRKNVTDSDTLAAISADIIRVMPASAGGGHLIEPSDEARPAA